MGKRKAKKTTAPNDIAPETWAKIGVWLADHLGDMERATFVLDEEMGADFMPALRGIAEHLRTGKSLIEPSDKARRLRASSARRSADSDRPSLEPISRKSKTVSF